MMTTRTPAPPAAGPAAGRALNQPDINDSTTFYNSHGRAVGRIIAGWLTKHVDSRVHQLRHPLAWAVDEQHIAALERLGAAGVALIDETGARWTATVATFRAHAIRIDRGHGQQLALPLSFWQTEKPGVHQLELWAVAS